MFKKSAIIFTFHILLTIFFSKAGYSSNVLESPSMQVERDFISNPKFNDEQIEVFILKPSGDGPFPVIFLLHGDQPAPSDGGKMLVDRGYLEKFYKEGILAVAISMPGYGHSDGRHDFAGPHSQEAIAAVINHFSQQSFVDPHRMGIYGISKGAILASLIHQHSLRLDLQILESGIYDVYSVLTKQPSYLENSKRQLAILSAEGDDAFEKRSAIFHTHNMCENTLILHGEFDDRQGLPSAKNLHEKLLLEKKNSTLAIIPNATHFLPHEKWSIIIPFIRERFFNLYGIGIQISMPTMPVAQIIKIYSNSPADLSNKLRLGDAILAISPNNDETCVDVRMQPSQRIVSLLLGKKGESVRMYVLHIDGTHEEIVIER